MYLRKQRNIIHTLFLILGASIALNIFLLWGVNQLLPSSIVSEKYIPQEVLKECYEREGCSLLVN